MDVSSSKVIKRRDLMKSLAVVGTSAWLGSTVLAACSPEGRVYGTAVIPPPSPGIAQKQLIYQGHKGPITAVSWSPDGTMVASGSEDRTVQVWRASDGVLLYTLAGYDVPVTSISWATDRSNVIASGGMNDGTVQVWDALKDHRERIFHGDGRVLALDWKQQSPWIVSGGIDRDVYTWNASTGAKGPGYAGHTGPVRAVAWLPDAQAASKTGPTGQVASGGADKTVQIWESATGKLVYAYRGHTGGINSIAALYPRTTQSLEAMASASDDGTVRIWVPTTGNDLNVYKGHKGKVNAVVRLPLLPYYNLCVASAGDDQTVHVWSSTSTGGGPLLVYRGHQAPVTALAASPVDRRVASGDSAHQVHVWTVEGFKQ